MFQVEFLLSASANFRFANVDSTFGIICLTVSMMAVGLALCSIGISAYKMHLIKKIKLEDSQDKPNTQSTTKDARCAQKEL